LLIEYLALVSSLDWDGNQKSEDAIRALDLNHQERRPRSIEENGHSSPSNKLQATEAGGLQVS
jgi:hypothetical protein